MFTDYVYMFRVARVLPVPGGWISVCCGDPQAVFTDCLEAARVLPVPVRVCCGNPLLC